MVTTCDLLVMVVSTHGRHGNTIDVGCISTSKDLHTLCDLHQCVSHVRGVQALYYVPMVQCCAHYVGSILDLLGST